jgi:hypothetical protein
MGCESGLLKVVLTELGHTVTEIGFSIVMISNEIQKAVLAEQQIRFHVLDAANPIIPVNVVRWHPLKVQTLDFTRSSWSD